MAIHRAVTRVFPIGHCIGAFSEDGRAIDSFFQVRIGPDVARLSYDEFAVWGLAHGMPDQSDDRPWNGQCVIDAGYPAGLPEPGRVLNDLLASQLLVEVTDNPESAVDFARGHRLLPLMLGLGNTAEEPRYFAAGLVGQPVVLMSSMIYDLFAWRTWTTTCGRRVNALRTPRRGRTSLTLRRRTRGACCRCSSRACTRS